MTDILLHERIEGVTVLTLNRPEVRNALNNPIVDALRSAVLACEGDGTCCIVITGAGGAFSSGADLKSAIGSTPEAVFSILTEHTRPANRRYAARRCPSSRQSMATQRASAAIWRAPAIYVCAVAAPTSQSCSFASG